MSQATASVQTPKEDELVNIYEVLGFKPTDSLREAQEAMAAGRQELNASTSPERRAELVRALEKALQVVYSESGRQEYNKLLVKAGELKEEDLVVEGKDENDGKVKVTPTRPIRLTSLDEAKKKQEGKVEFKGWDGPINVTAITGPMNEEELKAYQFKQEVMTVAVQVLLNNIAKAEENKEVVSEFNPGFPLRKIATLPIMQSEGSRTPIAAYYLKPGMVNMDRFILAQVKSEDRGESSSEIRKAA